MYNIDTVKETFMKVKKINLDESIFNDYDFNFEEDDDTLDMFQADDFDDDFSGVDYEKLAKMSEVPQGPKPGATTGVADTLIHLINDEWEAIRGYNDFIEMVKANMAVDNNSAFAQMLPVINDIVNEENKHVGQLQEVLKLISPNASSIEDGARESHQQFRFVEGKMPVQMMEQVRWDRNYTPTAQQTENTTPNAIDEYCSLSDVDDDM